MIAAGRRSKCSRDERLDPLDLDRLRAEALHRHRDGLRHADRVGHLELAAVGEAGGDDVLRDVAHRVRAPAVGAPSSDPCPRSSRRLAARRRRTSRRGIMLRPVSPVSALGPPTTNFPVGLTSTNPSSPSRASSQNSRGQDGVKDVLDDVGLHAPR